MYNDDMVRRCVALLALAGCGRFAFDERTDPIEAGVVDDGSAIDAPICHSGTWGIPELVTEIATTSHESDPTLSADGREVFFTSNRAPAQGYAIWTASRASPQGPFGPRALVTELDTAGVDLDPSLSSDGLSIVFTSDRVAALNDLYVATRSGPGMAFANITPLLVVGDPSSQRNTASLTNDGLGLYYTSGLDLAYATRATTTDDFTFVRLLAEVNAPQSDGTPSVTADGLELFFESYRTGGAALFRSIRSSTAEMFGPPVELTELGAAIPGATGYGGPEISPDGRTLYLFGATTSIDIYKVTRACP